MQRSSVRQHRLIAYETLLVLVAVVTVFLSLFSADEIRFVGLKGITPGSAYGTCTAGSDCPISGRAANEDDCIDNAVGNDNTFDVGTCEVEETYCNENTVSVIFFCEPDSATVEGLCTDAGASSYACDTGDVCWNGTLYMSACNLCGMNESNNASCDSDVGGSTIYVADGVCVDGNGAEASGTPTCDTDGDVCEDGSGPDDILAPDCSYCATNSSCMSAAATNYTANGLCASDNDCCTAEFVLGDTCGCALATNGTQCDNDVDKTYDGACAYSGSAWNCDTNTVFFNGSHYMTTGSADTDGYRCEDGAVGADGFTQEGLGSAGACDTTAHVVCPNGAGSACYAACGASYDGNNCDDTLTSGDFSATGTCQQNSTNDWICGSAPTITTNPLTISDGITPSYNSAFTVWCNGTVSDGNGYSDVSSVTGVLWDPATTTAGGSDDNDDHYSDSSCALSGGSGNTIDAACEFTVQWYAQPADWSCTVTANDASGLSGSRTHTGVTINQFAGVGGDTTIAFGTMALGATTATDSEQSVSIENRGNTEIDVNITSGGDLSCTIGTISDANIHYNTSQVAYANMCSVGTYCAETESSFDLRKRNSADASNPSTTVYWGIQIPASEVKGSCTTTLQYATV